VADALAQGVIGAEPPLQGDERRPGAALERDEERAGVELPGPRSTPSG
jgi:hypothetical protein